MNFAMTTICNILLISVILVKYSDATFFFKPNNNNNNNPQQQQPQGPNPNQQTRQSPSNGSTTAPPNNDKKTTTTQSSAPQSYPGFGFTASPPVGGGNYQPQYQVQFIPLYQLLLQAKQSQPQRFG